MNSSRGSVIAGMPPPVVDDRCSALPQEHIANHGNGDLLLHRCGAGWADPTRKPSLVGPDLSRVRVLSSPEERAPSPGPATQPSAVRLPGGWLSGQRRRQRKATSEIFLVGSKLPRAALRDDPFRRSPKSLVDALTHFGCCGGQGDEQRPEHCSPAVGSYLDLVVVGPTTAALVVPMPTEFDRDGSSNSSWINGGRKTQRGRVNKRASLLRHRDRLALHLTSWNFRRQPPHVLRGWRGV